MTNNIRALRKAAGMTMKQLGNLMGVSESTISLYENGKAEPDIAMLRKIADCFGVTIDYLLTDNPKDTKKPTCHTCELSDEEYRHLMNFRASSDEGRRLSDELLIYGFPKPENTSAGQGSAS
jgi:transcriptional regulator with XRE-family HTH domain